MSEINEEELDKGLLIKAWHLEDIDKNMLLLRPLFAWPEDWGKLLAQIVNAIVEQQMRIAPETNEENFRQAILRSFARGLTTTRTLKIGEEKKGVKD